MVTIFNDITQNLIPINWMNQSDFSRHPKLTQNLKSWLYETALLTTRLKQCAQNFQLKVLKETYGQQSFLLSDLPITDNNYIREIMMLSDNEPCILGQTTVPEDTLKHNGWANKLGSKGLGEALVNLPNVSRSAFNFSFCVGNNSVLKKYGMELPETESMHLWVRRSSFLIENRPLWVVEIFLPKICELK
jgi:chorismate-pyruvate lyase